MSAVTILALWGALGGSGVPAADASNEVGYVDASLDLNGELLDWRFVDVDLMLIPGASHHVPMEQPDVIADAIEHARGSG